MRVYHQVQVWKERNIPASNWGWRVQNNILLPIMMEAPPAPHNLLKLIICNCTKECRGHCSCFKHSLKCTAMCGECRGVSCCNGQDIIMDDVDIDTEL